MAIIGIHQADGKIPNLALMKVAYYHIAKGDTVLEWEKPSIFAPVFDKVYVSKLFDFTTLPDQLPTDAIIGGTGIDWKNTLPPEIEDCPPSYHLYPDCNYHIGFSMKGCRFACKFCCVPKKEGRAKSLKGIDALLINPNGGDKLMLLDNDFFGSQTWREDINRIADLNLKVSFVQGLNIRILTEEQAEHLSQVRYYNGKFKRKMLSFAWDRPNFKKDQKLIERGIGLCVKYGIPTSHMQFFVLIGFDSTPEQDLFRVMKLKEWGCRPFVMPFNKSDKYQKAFARWVNHTATFKSCSWNEYIYNPDNI